MDEWAYLYYFRNTASGIRFAKGVISNINGVILLPDDWDPNTFALQNTNIADASFNSNVISDSQWGELESAGVVFLPAAGYRGWGTSINNLNITGLYWTATTGESEWAYDYRFENGYIDPSNHHRYDGRSVRLVRSVSAATSYSIEAVPNPFEGGTVAGAGTYADGQTCTLTATPNEGYTFVNWTENGEMVSTDATYTFTVSGDRDLVANFVAPGSITNHWIPIEGTLYNMVVNGVIFIDGLEQQSATLEVGAFCGDECRASAVADYFPPTQQYVAVLTIVSNVASGETITFKLYDHETHQERDDLHCANTVAFENLTTLGSPTGWFGFEFNSEVSVTASVNPEGAGTVTGAGMYVPGTTATMVATANAGFAFRNWTVGGTVVSTESTYGFTVTEETQLVANFDHVQSQSLVNGWNWWSTWIDLPAAEGLAMLENSLGNNGVMVLSQNSNVQNYYPTTGYDYWFGSLSGIDLEKGYKVSTSAATEVTMVGPKADPADHPVTMKPNWNWIGYPVATAQSIATALGSYVPSANDVIVGQSSSSTYYDNYGWFPPPLSP